MRRALSQTHVSSLSVCRGTGRLLNCCCLMVACSRHETLKGALLRCEEARLPTASVLSHSNAKLTRPLDHHGSES
ncbi:hypothetical protein M3J09_013078 [Ascochyta lentis]